jgi:endonuclease YncB( thermonuclease family)
MPMNWRGVRSWAVMLLLFAVMVAAIVYLEIRPGETFSGKARAVDGDSLELGDRRVRLYGIDAPELRQTCEKADGTTQCGQRAYAELKFIISGKHVECEGFGFDRYDRTLARCRAGETDLGSAMVRAGWAISYGDYRGEERQARRDRAGIWAGEFIEPEDWRALNGQAAADFRFWQYWF